VGEGELGSVKEWSRPTTLLPVGIRVELIARSAVGAWLQLVPRDMVSTTETTKHRCNETSSNSRAPRYLQLQIPVWTMR
jgi:hypothetical protein